MNKQEFEDWYDNGEGSERMKREIAESARANPVSSLSCDRCKHLRAELATAKEKYTNLSNAVQLSCNPPDDCNDPVVLKTYMKACFGLAMKVEI